MPDILRYATFTQQPDGGNPAGVVLNADEISDHGMQQIAADVGYSESAFVGTVTGRHRYELRFFSPVGEVAFCGHATIATAVVMAEADGPGRIVFETSAGEVEVETQRLDGGMLASLRSVPTHTREASGDETARALAALGWAADDLDPDHPPHVAYAGNNHLMFGVRSRERLADLAYDFDALRELMLERDWTTVQLFWVEEPAVVHARDPFPVGGVVEDPATGAAAAALGGYFRELGLVHEPVTITIRQGEDMGRPSELTVDVSPDDPQVKVSGYAVPIVEY
ncbi:PhzF family phenazine biosynthesis protein [Arthrobacter castelli]|uniref:PhzF family phenazine biosynthesis protein n=1 Tax=Arthrobacter castelli TaxID=271431 RepID=UPI00047AC622|nr:PhzF family phenazine biosynthesis isomerase [Arthrobacter castelli]